MCFSNSCALGVLGRGETFRRRKPAMISHKCRSVILRLRIVLRALNSERREIVAQPRQRTLMQEASQVVGGIGQHFAAPDADEQVEIFALDLLRVGSWRPPQGAGGRVRAA